MKCYPVDSFKKEFNAKNITKARLYITACGLYEASINGIRVGDFILAPGHTDYKKRIQLQAYDVTNLINEGKNEIQILLADGWYRMVGIEVVVARGEDEVNMVKRLK